MIELTGSKVQSALLSFAYIYYWLLFRETILSPLHNSLTAQTLMSTQPVGNTISLMLSSVISVGIFADFLYHEIQITVVLGSSVLMQ